jgi:hypothetical protein
MGKTLILKPLLRSLNPISFMLIMFTFQLIKTIRILWFCHSSAFTHTIVNRNNNLSQVHIETYLDLMTCKDVTNVNIPKQKSTSILMLNNCILMHPTSILVRLSRPCL